MKIKISAFNKTYNVPLAWSDVTLGQFQQLASIPSGEHYTLQVLSVLLNMDVTALMKVTAQQLKEIEALLTWVNDKPSAESVKTFTIDGVQYGMIPNLDLMSFGEFVDLDKRCLEGVESWHEIASILYRPIVSTDNFFQRIYKKIWYAFSEYKPQAYKIEDYDATTRNPRAELFQERLSITQVQDAIVFFCLIGIECMNYTQDYLQAQNP